MVLGDNTQIVPTEATCRAADEPKALCIIRDTTNPHWQFGPTILNLPASTTGHQLLEEVAKHCKYVPGTFELILQRKRDGLEIPISDLLDQSLDEIGLHCENNARNTFLLMDKNGEQPKRKEQQDDVNLDNLSLGATALPSTDNRFPFPSSYYEPVHVSENDYNYSYIPALIKQETGYVGLVNQAMTCYLNSLLQTLFMTPEFRNALYRWEFDGSEQEGIKSIPYQLQKLFLQLQISKKHAIETTELTRSFGWDSSEAWQQHDVQELCRVMFDALEHKFKNTDQADLINHLYQGKLKDYVKCLQCGYESARIDTFLDIPLVIRPFGSNQSYGNVEEALKAFVQPETLEESNQYFCERCNKKCNAHKGFKFIKFPYLLTLQLKRFDFDSTTMHRIKLNDKMVFPEVLNLNSFFKNEREIMDYDECDTTDSGSGIDDNGSNYSNQSFTHHLVDTDEGIDEGIDIDQQTSSPLNNAEATANEKNLLQSREKGPYIYELFSIMVHSGSAAGGHYYAYIKSFRDGQWYCFNDQHVSQITYDDIRKTYGGGGARGYYTSAYASSTNAYMLMYRQIDKEKNADFLNPEDFPAHVKSLLIRMQEQEEAEQRQKELERSMCKIKLFCYHPIEKKMIETRLKIHKDKIIKDATLLAYKILQLEDVVPLEQCRLVKYDEFHDSLECSFEDENDVDMGSLLGGVKSSYKFDLLLEIRRADQTFQVYKPGGTTVKVYEIDLATEEINAPVTVRAYLTDPVSELKNYIIQATGHIGRSMRIVLECYYNDFRLLTNPNKSLRSEGFSRSNKVYIECSGLEDNVPFTKSKFFELLDRYQNTIRIFISLPAVDKEYLEWISQWTNSINQNHLRISETTNGHTECEQHLSDSPEEKKDSSKDFSDSSKLVQELDEGFGGESECDGHYPPFSEKLKTVADGTSHYSETLKTSEAGEAYRNTDSVNTSESNSLQESCEDGHILSSPEENAKEFSTSKETAEDWDADMEAETEHQEEEIKRFFRATVHVNNETGERGLEVYVDKRITLGLLKKELQPFIGVPLDYFKVYRVYSNNQEFECTKLSEEFSSYGDDSRLRIKLGRALKKGEYRVKIFQLLVNESETSKFLIDWVFAKGLSVLDSKKEIIPEIKAKCGIDIFLNRCRLRKKSWKNPGTIYLDNQKYDDDIPIFINWEVFLEVLPDPEKKLTVSQLAVFIRHWHPSEMKLDPFQEVILDETTVEDLKLKISQKSNIPVDCVEFSKGRGTFPCEMSLLDMQSELEWSTSINTDSMWPLYTNEDGSVIFYRNKNEPVMKLTEEQKKEIQKTESTRYDLQREAFPKIKNESSSGDFIVGNSGMGLSRLGQRVIYSPRKERALKIYTDSSPSASSENDLD